MKRVISYSLKSLCVSAGLILASCGGGGSSYGEGSSLTGWQYNSQEWGGFEVKDNVAQQTGPGLVLIEGGTMTIGQTEQDILYDYNNIPRRVTLASFYMDETEVANVHWREYLYWLTRVFGADYPEVIRNARPDTMAWRSELAYNDPYVEYYFRHPAYNFYPVVGVSWLQANDFCKWRTDRVNELNMIDAGILELNPNQLNEDNFNTDAYLAGQYEGMVKMNLPDLDPNGTGERRVRFDDGILLPDYRLPTEAEWEYAALALMGNNVYIGEELITDRRIYPWNGHSLRNPYHGAFQGKFLANFKRGRGDNMGVAGGLNDNAEITAPVNAFMPNDFGLYNMAGNVSEWVLDVYRQLSSEDVDDFNPFRGNEFSTVETDEDGFIAEKDSLGRIKDRLLTDEELQGRRDFRVANAKDYIDGDASSEVVYEYSATTLISNNTRVYKGGSWADRAYFLSPGTRRYLEEDNSSAQIGFRCAMLRVGSPAGNELPGGNNF